MSDFIHLHNHTDYSLLDAAQTVEVMCNRVYDLGMDSIAITDHGNLFGMIPFYKEAKKRGIKPIIGCEIYVSINDHTDKKQVITSSGKKWGYHHLVLLAQNYQGYLNLMKLCSIAYLDGFYYRPRVDKKLLAKYNEGLIATSACLAGEVTSFAALGDYENAKKAAIEYMNIFPERFYLELQNHNIIEEKKARIILKKLALELNIPLVATNDCHYCFEADSDAHDVLFCLGTGKDRSDTNRPKYEPGKFYLKSADEMHKIFKNYPNAIENTVKIAEQCNIDIPLGNTYLPDYPVPNEISSEKYLKQLCEEGIKKNYSNNSPDIQDRLNYELDVINKMGYTGYFLITQDFVNYAKNNNIPVGPGRGSAAGSLVAYSTGITDVDPIKYNLLFERFLNPERVTMPDIDIDFCIEGREKVIEYIKGKYGYKSVAQIITFGTLKAKSVIRDVGRVLSMSYAEVDTIAKLVPNELDISLNKACKVNPELAQIRQKSPLHKDLIDFSQKLEGCHRHASTHAAGVVIAPGPLTDYVPLFKNTSTGDVATQADMNGLEDIGLFKFDFLGLRNLTVIDKAITIIKQRHKKNININTINLEDSNVYKKIFSQSKTIGVFQFESEGMREYLGQLQPTSIEDLIALNALYRPGPMANIPEFISRKQGKTKIRYLHQKLEKILQETYGIIIYQEQVMEICSEIGGFSLAESDIIRRAMGKKKKSLMASYKIKFVEGAALQGITKNIAIEIFELLEKFAEYGFNKSHSTAYAIIAYQTAWLKYHYPIEFMTANISSDINDTDKVVKLISDAKTMGLNIEAPNINTSFADFTILDNHTIQYGLAAIKNIGYKIADDITQHRLKEGQYKSIFDLCIIKDFTINKKVLESLILVGACDNLDYTRAELFNSLELIIAFNIKYNKNKSKNQQSLFSADGDNTTYPKIDFIEPWSKDKSSKMEKELLGFYLTYNPLEKYQTDLEELSTINLDRTNKLTNSEYIQCGGLINEIIIRYDRKNQQWAILDLDTLYGKIQVFVFHKIYIANQNLLEVDKAVFIKGKISSQTEDKHVNQIMANKIYNIDFNFRKYLTQYINIQFGNDIKDQEDLEHLNKILLKHQGKHPLILHLVNSIGRKQKIKINKTLANPSDELLLELRAQYGTKNVWLS